MKAADRVLRTLRMLPEVYSDESRDFQLFTRLMDAVYNSCQFNANSILNASDPKYINSKLLSLLADKLGIDKVDAETLTDTEVRYILRCLPALIRNKGSRKALDALVNMYFKIYHISGTYELSIANKATVVQDITLSERTIILGLETIVSSTNMLKIMAKYLLPPGYSFFIYFYSKVNLSDEIANDSNITLLYTSTATNSEFDVEIPDFIVDNKYTWSTVTGSAHSTQIINAVDAVQLSEIASRNYKDFFIGYCTETDLSTICNNYVNPIEEEVAVNKFDVIKRGNIHKILVYDKPYHSKTDITEFSTWRTLETGSLVIVNTEKTTTNYYEAGDVFYFDATQCTFHKLNFTFSRKVLPDPSEEFINDYDVCCLLLKDLLFLWTGNETILIIELAALDSHPTTPVLNTAYYNTIENKYYVYVDPDKDWEECKEGPVLNGLLPDTQNFEAMTLYWKHGGDYYIYKNNNWEKYTYPIFFTKIIQLRDYEKYE